MALAARGRLVLIAALALGLAACATSGPAPSPTTKSAPADEATLRQYRALIADARVKHPYAESADRMYAVMMCESRGQANIVNPTGQYTGLFQYTTALWKGDWNSYRGQSALDPKAQILATALAWHKGMQSNWPTCYKKTG